MRQHLTALHGDGLVTHSEVRAGPGETHHKYRLSEQGDNLFPRRYAQIVTDLLVEAEAEDPAMIERMFARRRDRRVERARKRLEGLSFAQSVAELPKLLDEDGYLAEVVPQGDGALPHRGSTTCDPRRGEAVWSRVRHRGFRVHS